MNKFIFISVLLLVPFLSMAQTNYPDSLKQDITKVEITDSLKIDSSDFKFNFDDGINLSFNIKANIDSAASNIDLKDTKIIDKLNSHSETSIERRFNELIEKLVRDKSDIMAINNYIYKYCGYKKYDFFKDKTNVSVDVVINKKGLVNNTIGGEHE